MNQSTTSRRDFLRASALASAAFGAGSGLRAEEDVRKTAENKGSARNVIFMVSDGMNHGALSLAQQYQMLTENKQTHWMQLYRERPAVRCLMETFSANSCVTDSAAAASAWGSGLRVNNGTINVDADGKEVIALHAKLQAAGRRTGLVSTASITHATPAGFAASVDSRGEEAEIALQYLERRVDVLLGGGRKFFKPTLRQRYATADYDFIETRAALKALPNTEFKRLLGLFTEGYIPYSVDRNHVPELSAVVPTLAEMSQVALDRLKYSKSGFFLMIEGARIDHAGHANDVAASIHDQLAFDEAIGTALAFIDKNPDTLLIITTDHGCGGIQMNGVNATAKQLFAPGIYNASNAAFERVLGIKRSLEWMKQEGVSGLSGPKLQLALEEFTGLKLTAEQLKTAQGLKLAELYKSSTGVGWTSGNHTGELVEFCAYGPGSGNFPGFLKNYEVHEMVMKGMGVKVG